MAAQDERRVAVYREAMKLMRSAGSTRDRYHVISHGDRWAVVREGAQRAYRVFDRKADAVARAKSLAAAARGRYVIVHRKDGGVEMIVGMSAGKGGDIVKG